MRRHLMNYYYYYYRIAGKRVEIPHTCNVLRTKESTDRANNNNNHNDKTKTEPKPN